MYLLGLVGSGRIFSLFNAFELDRVKEMDHGHLGVWQYSGGSIGDRVRQIKPAAQLEFRHTNIQCSYITNLLVFTLFSPVKAFKK